MVFHRGMDACMCVCMYVGEAGVSPAIGDARPPLSCPDYAYNLFLWSSCLFFSIPDRRGADETRISSHIWLLMVQKLLFVFLLKSIKLLVLLSDLNIKIDLRTLWECTILTLMTVEVRRRD